MPRQVHENENLSGQTLTGPARRSLIRNCNVDGTVFKGDWRGTEYYDLKGAADWTQAQTYGSVWQGNVLAGSTFPTDIGYLHPEPIAEIIRAAQTATSIKSRWLGIADDVMTDKLGSSWDTVYLVHGWDGADALTRTEMETAGKALFHPYPSLEARFRTMVRKVKAGEQLWTPSLRPEQLKAEVTWPQDNDNFWFSADISAGFPAGVKSLYDFDQWAFGQVGKLTFTFSALPLMIRTLYKTDEWLDEAWEGY